MFFTHLGNKLDIIFQFIEDASSSDMVDQLAGIVTVWITITIMIKGYQAFAFNIGGYLTLVYDL